MEINKFPGQPSGLSIFAKIFLGEKQSRPDIMMLPTLTCY